MKQADFVQEFEEFQFPSVYGPWIALDAHDPPFKQSELTQMANAGLIVRSRCGTKYKLTIKATSVREKMLEKQKESK